MWHGQQFHIRPFSFHFFSAIYILFYSILFYIFFGTIICQLRPRPWRKVFILINESRWSAESWFAFAFAVLLLAFHSISESYQFEFLLSLTRHSIWNIKAFLWLTSKGFPSEFGIELARLVGHMRGFLGKGHRDYWYFWDQG